MAHIMGADTGKVTAPVLDFVAGRLYRIQHVVLHTATVFLVSDTFFQPYIGSYASLFVDQIGRLPFFISGVQLHPEPSPTSR